jgi:hypothetical protein
MAYIVLDIIYYQNKIEINEIPKVRTKQNAAGSHYHIGQFPQINMNRLS